MKRIKPFLLSVCILLMILILAGCWNYKEVENLAVVSGIAVDKKGDKYLVTAEIVDITGAKNYKITTRLLSVEGVSMFDAIRKMIGFAGKKLYFSHAKVVILSNEIAKEGIIPVIDWIGRDNEPRYTIHFLISKEKSAKRILEQEPKLTNVLSFELNNILVSQINLANALDDEEWQILNELSDMGVSITIPTVQLVNSENKLTHMISGTGVFREDKLIGYLDGEETKTLMFVKDEVKGGLLANKEYENSTITNISLEILKNRTNVIPKYDNKKITMEISTNTDVIIDENGGRENYITHEGQIKLKKDFEEILENNIKKLVRKVQKDYDSDIFGFGKNIKIKMPNLWKKIEPRWDEIFKNVDVKVHSTINIKNSSLQSKPIKVGD